MYRIARYISLFALVAIMAVGLTGCKDPTGITHPEDKLHHAVFFNTGTVSYEIDNSDPDIASQGNKFVILSAQSGVASYDWKARPHTIIIRTLVTHDTVATIHGMQPDEIDGNLSFTDARGTEYNRLDCYMNIAGGGWHASAGRSPIEVDANLPYVVVPGTESKQLNRCMNIRSWNQ